MKSNDTSTFFARRSTWMMATVVCLGSQAWATAPQWTDRSPSLPPSARNDGRLADEGNGKVLMFGGYTGAIEGDTYEWDGSKWIKRLATGSPGSPPARKFHNMASEGNGKVLMFGGSNGSSYLGDTWEWDGNTWTQKMVSGPTARGQIVMAYDSVRGKVVLFGGRSNSGFQQETWEWSGGAWSQKANGPSARTGSAMADEGNGKVLVFGGYDGSARNDCYEWDGTSWTNKTPGSNLPNPRYGHGLTYEGGGKVLMFGGTDALKAANQNSQTLEDNDTWEWNVSTSQWTRLLADDPDGTQTAGRPVRRGIMGITLDTVHGKVIMFGGGSSGDSTPGTNFPGGEFNDTWLWGGSSWTQQLSASANPATRHGHGLADEGNGKLLMYGGYNGTIFSDTWEWNGSAWSLLSPLHNPGPRFDFGFASEGSGGKILLFGGNNNSGTFLGDTWEWNGSDWIQVSTSGPAAREGTAMAADGAGKVLLYGGLPSSGYLSDTWQWSNGAWTNINVNGAVGSPPGRAYHAMAPEAGGKVLMFGGQNAPGNVGDTWEYSAGTWSQLTPAADPNFPAASPTARSQHSMTFDSVRLRVILFGGQTPGAYVNETWEWNGVTWIHMAPTQSPNVRVGAGLAYDSLHGKTVLFAGDKGNTNGGIAQDTWDYFGTPPSPLTLVKADLSPAAPGDVHFTATFSEAVTGVDAGDFSTVAGGGVTGSSVSGAAAVQGSQLTSYTVTANSGSGEGSLSINLVDNDTIRDLFGYPIGGAGTGNGNLAGPTPYVIDIPPVVKSIKTADGNPTKATVVHFNVVFSKSVTGVDATDFTLTTGSAVSGASITGVSGSGASYVVTVGAGSGDGSIRLDLTDDDTIKDAATMPLGGYGTGNGSFSSGQSYTIDRTPPTVASINRVSAASTNAASVNYTVTFSEAVTGVVKGDFSITSTGGISGASVNAVSGSGATYTVTVNTGTGDGTLRLDLIDDDSITDLAGNPLWGSGVGNGNFTTGQVYTVDKTRPTISIGAPSAGYARSGQSITYLVTYSDANFSSSTLSTSDITLNKTGTANAAVAVSGSGNTRTVTLSTLTGDGSLGISIATGTATDTAGNTAPSSSPSATFVVDNTPPSVDISAPSAASVAAGQDVTFTVTYTDANFSSSSLAKADITLNTTNSATATVGVTGTGNTRTVTLSNTAGNGSLSISIAAGTAVDLAGNSAPAAGPSASFTVQTVDHFTVAAPSSATAGSAFNVTVTAYDSGNQVLTGYSGKVHFSSSDPKAVLHSDSTLTNGSGTFSVTLKTAGSRSVAVNDTVRIAATGTTNVTINPSSVDHLALVQQPSSSVAGLYITPAVTVQVQDAYNNLVSSDTRNVQVALAPNANNATLYGSRNLAAVAGVATFSTLSVQKAGIGYQLQATAAGLTGATSSAFNVTPAAATKLVLAAPATITAGAPFSLTVTASDDYGNTDAGYRGPVHFSGGGAGAALPADYSFVAGDNGSHNFANVTLGAVGNQTVTATDTATNTITGNAPINVTAFPGLSITDVSVTESAPGTVNAVFTVSLSVAATQTVTVDYATADGTAKAPGRYTATNGTLTFAPGDTTKTVTVQVNGDYTVEPTQSFFVNLTNQSNASVSKAQGVGTISEGALPPTISSFTPASGRVGTIVTISGTNFKDITAVRFGGTDVPPNQIQVSNDGTTITVPVPVGAVTGNISVIAHLGEADKGTFTVTSPWQAVDIAVGPDNKTRALWNNSDGTTALWVLSASGNLEVNNTYTNGAGWSSQGIAVDANNLTRMLWVNSDGRSSIWNIAAGDQTGGGGKIASQVDIQHYPGWTPVNIAIGADNLTRVLWTKTDNTMALWVLDANNNLVVNNTYGPYPNWHAQRMAVGGDNKMRVLWDKDDGTTALWLVAYGDHTAGGGGLDANVTYGPIANWTARSIATTADNDLRVLWDNTDGTSALWRIDSSGKLIVNNNYGPYQGGWFANALATGADGQMRVQWSSPDGHAAFWVVAPGDQSTGGGTLDSNFEFGPY